MLGKLRLIRAALIAMCLAVGAAAPARAQSAAGESLRQSALKLYRADTINGANKAGAYELLYARMFELGIAGRRNLPAARALYESTLKYCHGDIANRLAMMLMRGVGGPVDKKRAAEMHLKAVECHNQYFDTPTVQKHPGWIDPQTVKAAQKLLKQRSLYDGPVNGQLDAATRGSIAGLE